MLKNRKQMHPGWVEAEEGEHLPVNHTTCNLDALIPESTLCSSLVASMEGVGDLRSQVLDIGIVSLIKLSSFPSSIH